MSYTINGQLVTGAVNGLGQPTGTPSGVSTQPQGPNFNYSNAPGYQNTIVPIPSGPTGPPPTGYVPGSVGAVFGNQGTNAQANTQDRFSYGGSFGGPAAWTQYYQGLGNTAAQQAGAAGVAQQAGANALGQSLYANAAAMGGQGLGSASSLGQFYANAATGAGQAAQGQLSGLAQGFGGTANAANGYAASGLGMLQQAAMGQGPSAAQAQLGAGTAQDIRAQLAAAASATGGPYAQAAARNAAAGQAAGMESSQVGQAAQLRAQEQQAAQQALTQGGISQYGTAAGLLGQAGMAGAQTGLTAAQMAGGFGQAGLATGLNTQEQAAALGYGADQSLYGLGAQQGLAYSTLGAQQQAQYNQMAQAVQQTQMNTQLQKYAADVGVSEAGTQLAAQTGGAAASAIGAGLMGAAMLSDPSTKTDVQPQGAAGAAAYGAADQANAAGGFDAQGHQQALLGMLQNIRSSISGAFAGPPAQAPQVQSSPVAPGPMPPMGVGSVGQGITSDPRAKTAVAPAPTADAFLDTLARSKATYAYKDPANEPLSPMHPRVPGARFGGVMADQLQRTPEMGPSS